MEYFEQVLNAEGVREAKINVGSKWRMPALGELNETAISMVHGSTGGSELNKNMKESRVIASVDCVLVLE